MLKFARRVLTVVAVASAVAAQSTLVVPVTHPTIQAAIVAALPTDTVLVLPGTYFESIDFLGKAITVKSLAGAAATAIDGNYLAPVVTFHGNETPASVLDGFTITHGQGVVTTAGPYPRSTAGGIQCTGASPTIRRCTIAGNQGGPGAPWTVLHFAGNGGPGGVLAEASAMRLVDCALTGNVGGSGGPCAPGIGTGGFGGNGGAGGAYLGFTVAGSTPEVVGCRFLGNTGGVGGNVLASGVQSLGGRGGDGGVELFTTAGVRVANCLLHGNTGGTGGNCGPAGGLAGAGGHGAFAFQAPTSVAITAVLMSNCVVTGNTGGNGGLGFNAYGGDGGGATGASAFTAIGVTIAGNAGGTPLTPVTVTGGLTVSGYTTSSATLRNCILWGNTRGGLPSDLSSSTIVANVTTSDLGAVTGTVFGSGNLNTDPLFANLAGGDVHITEASPCRHAGSSMPNLPPFDIDGDPRTVGPATDMGADEWDGLVGSREDFALELLVNGAQQPAVVASTAPAGSVVAVRVWSPVGGLASAPAIVGFELWLPPTSPSGPALLPELHLSGAAVVLAQSGGGVGTGGSLLATTIPPGLAGLAFRVQAFAFTGAAGNGVFAATAARDLLL